MSNTKHAFDKKILKAHVRTSDTEGGACLNRHISGVSRSSCSHRYQARERAKDEDRTWYVWPAYRAMVRAGKASPNAWDVTGTNFTKAHQPYAHQAHHLVPNATLSECILATAEGALERLIRLGLLEAKYNLNHKKNMIILPMEKDVGLALKLPIHLREHARSHESYSKIVEAKVKSVIEDYAKVLNEGQDDKKHDAPPNKLARAKLERLSKEMRIMLWEWGRIGQGRALEDHADPIVKKME